MKKISIIFTLLFSTMIFAGAANAQTNKSDEDKVYKQSEVDQKALITTKPRASTNGQCGRGPGTNGTTRIAVVLRKTGEVSDVKVAKSSPCATFNQNALAAARNIKFKTAMKDGQAVSVAVWVEYSYRMF
jgi:TonB family protein